ncbi:Solute carrier family 25 member 36 [Armadillidium nasatum]|uniref:Solute carrier family 25 member 36 n=1 Tax=Armadillidium nasatum TaxID=96803 RepID=A0A5N5TG92_9CRUS|nr:Solute carrier family 25 member 36 [Armadillidium nasatum]
MAIMEEFIVFFEIEEIVHKEFGPRGQTINHNATYCLTWLRPFRGIFEGYELTLTQRFPGNVSSWRKRRNYCTDAQVIISRAPSAINIFVSTLSFTACTVTNPIWFVKTRLQLDQSKSERKLRALDCIRNVYKTKGILGFYKGLTASYYGISETVIHFVIYEGIKSKLQDCRQSNPSHKSTRDFFEFMLAGATSKTIASCFCYPHEVARTRLREEGKKYKGFWQTLGLVLKEEGWHGLYRGLATQLIRQIPNTAIMMATYEGVVYVLTNFSVYKNRTRYR